jgi:hypothetical protein
MEGGEIPIDITGADSSGVAGTKPKFFGKTATLVAVNSAEIECKFYTPKGSQLQDARCVVNYHEIGIYRTANFGKIDPPVADPRTYGLMKLVYKRWLWERFYLQYLQESSLYAAFYEGYPFNVVF